MPFATQKAGAPETGLQLSCPGTLAHGTPASQDCADSHVLVRGPCPGCQGS